jgi:hypothetical protein
MCFYARHVGCYVTTWHHHKLLCSPRGLLCNHITSPHVLLCSPRALLCDHVTSPHVCCYTRLVGCYATTWHHHMFSYAHHMGCYATTWYHHMYSYSSHVGCYATLWHLTVDFGNENGKMHVIILWRHKNINCLLYRKLVLNIRDVSHFIISTQLTSIPSMQWFTVGAYTSIPSMQWFTVGAYTSIPSMQWFTVGAYTSIPSMEWFTVGAYACCTGINLQYCRRCCQINSIILS